jgi:excisionase family DNA binding protein
MTEVPPDTIAVLQVPALLSVATVARVLDVSPRTVRRRIDDGELPAVREHDRIVIRADELLDYINQLKRLGQPPGRKHRGATRAVRRYDSLR